MNTQTAHGYINANLKLRLNDSQATILVTGMRVLAGGTICAAGILKVVNQDSFYRSLSSYGVFSHTVMELISSVLPHVEAMIGLLFVFGIATRLLGTTIAVMLVTFTLIAGLAFASGRAVDCGCFPVGDQADPIGIGFFLRNILLTLSTLWVVSKTRPEGE